MIGRYADISTFNTPTVDWRAYKSWSSGLDGISRVMMRASYGNGYVDTKYNQYRSGATGANIGQIGYYHYAYPQYTPSAQAEANWFLSVVGTVRSQDWFMLDFEESAPEANAQWALDFCNTILGVTGKRPTIYASRSMVESVLTLPELSAYPLTLAQWTYDNTNIPSAPWPWNGVFCWQWTDRDSIPGLGDGCDSNLYIDQGSTMTQYKTQALTFMFKEVLPTVRVNTGIFNAWMSLASNNIILGPAITNEQDTIDWNGNKITRQTFAFGWIEWSQTSGNMTGFWGGIRI